jgi:hypothetical protein
MGTSIGYILELRHKGKWLGLFTDDPWNEAAEVQELNRSAWARLIGLRNPGIPPDHSDLTDYHVENAEGNMHYPGWLPFRDFCSVYERLVPDYYRPSDSWEKLFGSFFFYKEWEYRLIFWMNEPWDEASIAEFQKN